MPQKPQLGQNFLVDTAASRTIAESLGNVSETTVVEIGPGRGAITKLLSTRARKLIAVELDRAFAAELRNTFADKNSVEVIQQDILTVDLASLVTEPAEKLKVVGNLPYYITSSILLRLFEFHTFISQAVIMVQREVADRIAARPGTSDFGLLSATSQLYAEVENLLTLPPTAFSPPPEVHSTVLRLTMAPRFDELQVAPGPFIRFLKQSFAQKRKTLANNLRSAGYESARIAAAFSISGVSPMVRSEALPLEASAALFRALISGEQKKAAIIA